MSIKNSLTQALELILANVCSLKVKEMHNL